MVTHAQGAIPGANAFKALPRGYGPFQVLERINDNAYKLDLPGEYTVSATFNVTDLSPFDAGDDLRENPFQDEGNDEDMTKKTRGEPFKVPVGPVTRARAKRFKDDLPNLIIKLEHDVMDVCPKEAVQGDQQLRLVHVIRSEVEEP